MHPVVGVSLLSGVIGGFDFSKFPVDGPVPDLPETNGPKSRQRLLPDLARRENLRIRDLYLRIAGARGHQQVVGTPSSIADQLQQWFEEGGADGFNIMSPWFPGGLDDFIELVLPEPRRCGTGRTLREHLGLQRPAHPARQALEEF
ncbi:Nitrilotriacetate monooxygenase component A [compost metagenome]